MYRRCLFVFMLMFWLAACVSRQPQPMQAIAAPIPSASSVQTIGPDVGPDDETAEQSMEEDHRWDFPEEDGRPLTEEEREAFLSTGDFDVDLTREQQLVVLKYFKHLIHRDRRTVEESVARACRYLEPIRDILWRRGLPLDLAYIPFVESNYDMFVRPSSGAVGLWQFIPSTAMYYGMRKTLWIDQRRDLTASTNTAAFYFARLYRIFGDWHLAIAAYNAGEGKILKAMRATGASTYFELREKDKLIKYRKLRMTKENRQYVPKFLAVCKIMRNLQLLGFTPVAPRPDVSVLRLKPGIDLDALAKIAGMTWDTFLRNNGGFIRHFSPFDEMSLVTVPEECVDRVSAWLHRAPSDRRYASWQGYVVHRRDSIRSIATRCGSTIAELRRVNQLEGRGFRAGVEILVPRRPSKLPLKTRRGEKVKVGKDEYLVRHGDSVWLISKRFSIPYQRLLDLNGMNRTSRLWEGMVLRLR